MTSLYCGWMWVWNVTKGRSNLDIAPLRISFLMAGETPHKKLDILWNRHLACSSDRKDAMNEEIAKNIIAYRRSKS